MTLSTDLAKDAALFMQQDTYIWESPMEAKNKETAFFTQLVAFFTDDSELPIEQLMSFPPDTIIDYLAKAHFVYLNKRLPEIEQHLSQLSTNHHELSETLASVFAWLRKNMEKHFRVEEQSLFPYISDLAKVDSLSLTKEAFKAKYKDFSVKRFVENHDDDVENKLAEIKKYIVRSLESMEALFPYRVLLQKLDILEKELRMHARIEEEVLIPVAMEKEKLILGLAI